MHVEIGLAADFLIDLLKIQRNKCKISEMQLNAFRRSFSTLLRSRYKEHWFPDHPNKGSGYRCIRINSKMDPLVIQAGAAVGLCVTILRKLFPSELTLWIDPQEVSYRIGENGSICALYEIRNHIKVAPPPRESPELYFDPRQMEQSSPVSEYGNCF